MVSLPDIAGTSFVDSYLQRLGVATVRDHDLDALRRLHAAHLKRIPFENLSNHLGETLSLAPEALADKILRRRRGGFCYELNGLFSMLLSQLGYEVTLLGARVWGGEEFGPPLDHLVLSVGLPEAGNDTVGETTDAADGAAGTSAGGLAGGAGGAVGGTARAAAPERWIVDVGFGDHSVYPLPWSEGQDHHDPGGVFRLERSGNGDWDLYRNGRPQYRIEPNERVLPDFAAMCWYHQCSPNSHFTQTLVCSRLTAEDSRLTLSGRRLITTSAGVREELELAGDERLLAAYRDQFGIELDRVPGVSC